MAAVEVSEVEIEAVDGGAHLRVTIPCQDSAPAAVLAELLAAFELSSPGDTNLRATSGGVTVSRFAAGSDLGRRHEAAAELAKLAASVAEAVGGVSKAGSAHDAVGQVPPPAFAPAPPEVAQLTTRYWTVVAPQPGWAAPDPATDPAATLLPGVWLDLLERLGDWARVRSEAGDTVYTDGRTLVVAGDGGAQP